MNSNNWIDICEYRNFYDIPRIFVFSIDGKTYLFDCEFDDEIDDFSPHYEIYEMADLSLTNLPKNWHELKQRPRKQIGRVATTEVEFDATMRNKFRCEKFMIS